MRILLVEDDQRIARFVTKGLREQAYAVDVTGDGDDAFYKLSINDYDAVILDVMIPGRDGFQVCRDMRSAGIDVPVIMLTARDTVQDRITGLDSGADDYLIKPFAVTELLARLRALLRRAQVVRRKRGGPGTLNCAMGGGVAWRENNPGPFRSRRDDIHHLASESSVNLGLNAAGLVRGSSDATPPQPLPTRGEGVVPVRYRLQSLYESAVELILS